MPYDFRKIDKTTPIYIAYRKLVDSIDGVEEKIECPTPDWGLLFEFKINGWDVGIELDCHENQIIFFGVEIGGRGEFDYDYNVHQIDELRKKLTSAPFDLALREKD